MSADLETLLSRAEALDKAATPGKWWDESGVIHARGPEWTEANHSCIHPATAESEADAAFIAEARTLLPQMARVLRKATAVCVPKTVFAIVKNVRNTQGYAAGYQAAQADLRSALTPDADGDGGGQ